MRKTALIGMVALIVPATVAAHAWSMQQSVTSNDNPVTAAAQMMSKRFGGLLVQAAEAVPAGKLSYKPTKAQMSFGQIWNHLADANYGICGTIGGTKGATVPAYTGKESKESLVAQLKASFEFCDQVLAKANDSNLGETVDMGFMKGSRALAEFVYVEDLADHYSQVANYMRLNGMLPPSAKKK
jgi:DinB superfamily